jgi:hypothetical protein
MIAIFALYVQADAGNFEPLIEMHKKYQVVVSTS